VTRPGGDTSAGPKAATLPGCAVRSSTVNTDPPPDQRCSVLLSDDNTEIRDAIRAVLENTAQFWVIGEASDGDGCLDRIRKDNPDVLILDVNMPGGGPDLAKAAKRLSPDLQILVYSSNTDKRTHREMLDAGADDYVVKTGRTRPLLDGLQRAVTRIRPTSR